MKDFVNSILSGARQSLATSDSIKQDTGMDRQKPEVPNANINQNLSRDDSHKTSIDKYDLQVTESLKRINDLISKLI